MKAALKETFWRKIAFALKHPSSETAQKIEEKLKRLPAGSPVPIYRERSKTREGWNAFVNIYEGFVVVQMQNGRQLFRSSTVKSAAVPCSGKWQNVSGDQDENNQNCALGTLGSLNSNDDFYALRDVDSLSTSTSTSFTARCKKELEGLLQKYFQRAIDIQYIRPLADIWQNIDHTIKIKELQGHHEIPGRNNIRASISLAYLSVRIRLIILQNVG